jgi:energy-coupling factor transporter ATP-binding protein EcfA2
VIDKISLKNFTVFEDVEIDFTPRVNVIVGQNGTGKTHLLKAAYAICSGNNSYVGQDAKVSSEQIRDELTKKFLRVFRPTENKIGRLKRHEAKAGAEIGVSLFGEKTFQVSFNANSQYVAINENDRYQSYSWEPVFIPTKEIEFFNKYYDKGWNWYRTLYPDSAANTDHRAFGEFSGSYLYMPEVPQRIVNHSPNVKMLVILRNPANRAYSQFRGKYYTGVTKCSTFTQFISDHPFNVRQGCYAHYLAHWFSIVNRENVKIFIFEEVIKDHESFKSELSKFLDIDPNGFDDSLFAKKTNPSNAPKLRSLYRLGFKVSRILKNWQLHRLSTFIARIGSRFFSMIGHSQNTCPPMREDDYAFLMDYYKKDIRALTSMLDRSELIWK